MWSRGGENPIRRCIALLDPLSIGRTRKSTERALLFDDGERGKLLSGGGSGCRFAVEGRETAVLVRRGRGSQEGRQEGRNDTWQQRIISSMGLVTEIEFGRPRSEEAGQGKGSRKAQLVGLM